MYKLTGFLIAVHKNLLKNAFILNLLGNYAGSNEPNNIREPRLTKICMSLSIILMVQKFSSVRIKGAIFFLAHGVKKCDI